MEKRKYPIGAENYTLYEEVGQGVSASVHRALCNPLNEVVAIKVLDFERVNCDLNNVSREAQTMFLVDHPNVLKSHCSFVSEHNLWVVMPYMAGGSCLHILKAAYPEGFEEVVIATILREVLKGLEYLHHHGHIHRDVKAGNILIDSRGAIKLGDFGVSACLFDSGDRQRVRNTFVGTPCWMAPEVMEQLHGYDFKADIWSFGITALELAHGHAPFSKYPPMKVLLMTLQNAPPGLDYERDKKFSKSFKQMIASCLVKDPSKRPSAKKLLKHSFFKKARSNDYIARTLLEGLPELGDRLRALMRKEEDMLAQKKIPDGQKEEISQNEYKRGISGWNFNLEDVKAQASLIQDEDCISDKDQPGISNSFAGIDLHEKHLCHQLSSISQYSEAPDIEDNNLMRNQPPLSSADSPMTCTSGKCERSDDDLSIASSSYEHQISQTSSPCTENHIDNYMSGNRDLEINARPLEGTASHPHDRVASAGSIILLDGHLPISRVDSEKLQNQFQRMPSSNGFPAFQIADDSSSETMSKASKTSVNSDEVDDKVKCQVVQQKGRFKVTSENVDLEKVAPSPLLQKSHSMQVSRAANSLHLSYLHDILDSYTLKFGWESGKVIPQHPTVSLPSPSEAMLSNSVGHSFYPVLQSVLQSNILQREAILSLMKQVTIGESPANRAVDGGCIPTNTSGVEKSLLETAHDREKELLHEVTDLRWRLVCAQEELQKYKNENAQV